MAATEDLDVSKDEDAPNWLGFCPTHAKKVRELHRRGG